MESRTTSQSTASQDDLSDPINKTLIPAIEDCAIAKDKEEEVGGGWKKQGESNIGWSKDGHGKGSWATTWKKQGESNIGRSKDGRGKGGWATTWENRKNVPRGRTWAERFEEQRLYFRNGSTASNEQIAAKE